MNDVEEGKYHDHKGWHRQHQHPFSQSWLRLKSRESVQCCTPERYSKGTDHVRNRRRRLSTDAHRKPQRRSKAGYDGHRRRWSFRVESWHQSRCQNRHWAACSDPWGNHQIRFSLVRSTYPTAASCGISICLRFQNTSATLRTSQRWNKQSFKSVKSTAVSRALRGYNYYRNRGIRCRKHCIENIEVRR